MDVCQVVCISLYTYHNRRDVVREMLDEAAQAESVGIARLQRRLRRSLSPLDAARDAGGLSNEREGAAELQRMRHARQDGGAEHSPRLSNALDAKPTDLQLPYATRIASTASLAEICEARLRLRRCRVALDKSVLAASSTAGNGSENSSSWGASSTGLDVSVFASRRLLIYG